MPIVKPLLSKIWANAAGAPDLESPDDPKYATGWVYGEKPPHKQMNWLQWTFSKALAHLNEYGVLEHDLLTTYPLGAYVWKDGKVYRSRVAGNVNNVVTLPSKWQEQSLPDMPTSGDGFILYYSGSKLYWKDQRDIAYTPYQGRTASDNKSLILPNDNTTGNAPVATEINIGELAINFKDKAIYTKNPEGAIIQLGGAASIVDKEFTLTEGQTTVQPVGGYAVNQIEVFMNGRKLSKTEYVANDGVSVILNSGGKAADLLVVSVWNAFTVANVYTQAQVDALLAAQETTLLGQMLGINQTWQDLTSSRVVGEVYTNTSGKPIALQIGTTVNSGNNVTLINVDGVTVSRSYSQTVSPYKNQNDVIVPKGSTYSLEDVNSVAIVEWLELR